MEFLGHIGIDLKTVAAQAVNFLILATILRLLLYKPLIAVLDKRKAATEKLQKELAEIEKKKNESEAAYRAKLLDAEGRANEIILKARKSVDAFTDTSLDKTRDYIDDMLQEARQRVEGAKGELAKLNKRAVSAEAHRMLREFLSEKLRRELHETLLAQAMDHFDDMGSREEDIAFKGALTIEIAYPISRTDEKRLQKISAKKFGKRIRIESETNPDLGAGIILSWGGWRLDGSLAAALEQKIGT
ncbi:MAG: F0F1 ATP synthase subunit delta [bacterium]|nr:F0F1 ATP synthase subunit delta [bacterium]